MRLTCNFVNVYTKLVNVSKLFSHLSVQSAVQHTMFEAPSFTDSKDITGSPKCKIWIT